MQLKIDVKQTWDFVNFMKPKNFSILILSMKQEQETIIKTLVPWHTLSWIVQVANSLKNANFFFLFRMKKLDYEDEFWKINQLIFWKIE